MTLLHCGIQAFYGKTHRIGHHQPHDVENTPWWNTLQASVVSRMEIREALAHNLKVTRRAKGLSQEELAHRADLDRTYVSALERCVYAASIDVLDRLAKVLEVETADLLRLPSASADSTK